MIVLLEDDDIDVFLVFVLSFSVGWAISWVFFAHSNVESFISNLILVNSVLAKKLGKKREEKI